MSPEERAHEAQHFDGLVLDRIHVFEVTRETIIILLPDFALSRLKFSDGKYWDPDSETRMRELQRDDLDSAQVAEVCTDFEPEETGISPERLERGWAEVATTSYGPLLDHLEEGKLGKAYAVGYDFRQSGQESAAQVFEKIQKILDEKDNKDAKVVLVTHGTGGLLARSLFEEGRLDQEAVFGVVHIAQPVLGAPEVLRRMIKGHPVDGDSLLGRFAQTPQETQALFASMPGSLLLLPPQDEAGKWNLPASGLEGNLVIKPFELPSPDLDAETEEEFRAALEEASSFLKPLATKTFHPNTISIYMDGISTEQMPHYHEPPQPDASDDHPHYYEDDKDKTEAGPYPQPHEERFFTELLSGEHLEIPPEPAPEPRNWRVDRLWDGDGLIPTASASALFQKTYTVDDLDNLPGTNVRQLIVSGVEHEDCSHPDLVRAARVSIEQLLYQKAGEEAVPEDFGFLESEQFERKNMDPSIPPSVKTLEDLKKHGLFPKGLTPTDQNIAQYGLFAFTESPVNIPAGGFDDFSEGLSGFTPPISLDKVIQHEQLVTDPDQWLVDRCKELGFVLLDTRSDPDREAQYDQDIYGYVGEGSRERGGRAHYENPNHPKFGQVKPPRDPKDITNATLHITGTPETSLGKNTQGVPVHAFIQGDGIHLILLHHFEDYMHGGDDSNPYSIQIEVNGDKEKHYNPRQIAMLRLYLTYFYGWRKKMCPDWATDPNFKTTVGAHWMYQNEKPHDCGAEIWEQTGDWSMSALGFYLDDVDGGSPIHPWLHEAWDPLGKGTPMKIQSQMRAYKFGDASLFPAGKGYDVSDLEHVPQKALDIWGVKGVKKEKK